MSQTRPRKIDFVARDKNRFPNSFHTEQQKGAITIFAAFAFIVLLGFISLAVDTGRAFAVKSELQNAADSCALAGVLELNGSGNALTRAENVAIRAGKLNYVKFQSANPDIASSDITFSESLNGTFSSKNDGAKNSSHYIRCSLNVPSLLSSFGGVIGFDNFSIHAVAVAGVRASQTTCSLPMSLCRGNQVGASSENFGYLPSQSVAELGGNQTSGFFTWTNVLGNTNSGLSDYQEAFRASGKCGVMTAPNRCIAVNTGVITSLDEDWNARFGVYKASSTLDPSISSNTRPSMPDLTGHGYSTEDPNKIISDYLEVKVPARAPFSGLIPGYTTNATINSTYGTSYRRLTVMPVVDCASATCGTGAKPIVGWACVLMFSPKTPSGSAKILFIGRADSLSSPCRVSGVPGGGNSIGPMVPVLFQ